MVIQYGCKNKETLFKGAKTDQQIRDTYRPLVREKDLYKPVLRTKVILEKVRVWDFNHQPAKIPESKFEHAELWPKVRCTVLWAVNGQWGLTLEVTDLKFKETLMSCPFVFFV